MQARFWEAVAGTLQGQPRRLLLRPDERAGRARRASARPATGSGPPSAASTSSSSSPWTRPAARGPTIARQWVKQLAAAIRKHDKPHLVTVGLVDWSLDRPGLTSGFVPEEVAADLDFLCVHLYPEKGKVDEALETLQGVRRRQAGGDRGDVPAEVLAWRSSSSSSTSRGRTPPAGSASTGARRPRSCGRSKTIAAAMTLSGWRCSRGAGRRWGSSRASRPKAHGRPAVGVAPHHFFGAGSSFKIRMSL